MPQLKINLETNVPSVNHYCVTTISKQGKVLRFPSKQSNSFKKLVKDAFSQAYPDHAPVDCDVEVVLNLGFKTPQTHDVDNYGKVPLDALTGIAYKDDKQIVSFTAKKFRSTKNCIEIQINY